LKIRFVLRIIRRMKNILKNIRHQWHNDILHSVNILQAKINDINNVYDKKQQESLDTLEICQENRKDFRDRLYTPTLIQKIDDLYYIVDCWHHRIIYSNTVERPISSWNILDENIGGPHSVVSNGDYLFVENTGYNSMKIFKRNVGGGGGGGGFLKRNF
jgi:hypothetical protein